METLKHITLGLTIGVLLMIGANSMGAVVKIVVLPEMKPLAENEVQNDNL